MPIELQNADSLAPPFADNGQVSNFKWAFSLSHNKMKKVDRRDSIMVSLQKVHFSWFADFL